MDKERTSQKGILEYDLEDFDARQAHMRAIKSLDIVLALNTFKEELRSKIKHTDNADEAEYLEKAWDLLHEKLDHYGVVVDDLIS